MSFYEEKLLIIIPAYNEEKNIGGVLDALLRLPVADPADVLVIDDASRDATAGIARKHGVRVIRRKRHRGYGSALQLGYRYAVRRDYAYVIQLDADGQHDVRNVEKIYARLRTPDDAGRCPDLILGSRFLPGAGNYPVSLPKQAAYALFRGMIRLLSGKKITDPTTGLQGLGRRAFTYYAEKGHFDEKYPDANVLLQMLLLGYLVEEIPAMMYPRTKGVSMHWGLGPLEYMFRMLFSTLAVWLRIRVLHREDADDHMVS